MDRKKKKTIRGSPISTASAPPTSSIRILAIASGGGHWLELLRLRSILEEFDIHYVNTGKDWEHSVTPHPYYVVPDANLHTPWRIIRTFFCMLRLFRKIRPQVVISTGAAPGGLALLLGRIFRARTLWIDSAANSVELSLSGRIALKMTGTVLTQWPELARPGGPYYRGNILV